MNTKPVNETSAGRSESSQSVEQPREQAAEEDVKKFSHLVDEKHGGCSTGDGLKEEMREGPTMDVKGSPRFGAAPGCVAEGGLPAVAAAAVKGDGRRQAAFLSPERETAVSMSDLVGQAVRNMAGAAAPAMENVGETGKTDAPAAVNRSRCDELVERILVSRPGPDGSAEVRIKLDQSWLPETEVRLVKTPGADLAVEFVSDSVESQRFLLPNLSTLRDRLAERTGSPVQVGMSEHADAGADTGDGRSRNRRSLYDEYTGSGE